MLKNSDFLDGTYQITKPGLYRLTENITFNPNSRDRGSGFDSRPKPSQLTTGGGPYDARAFGLGFFAAITIAAPNVEIDLNGFALVQSEEHALLQRFFALIELGNAPFPYDQGPHNFTVNPQLVSASNVQIHNGYLGRASHHGIHGFDVRGLVVTNVTIADFEVAGISLNGATEVRILHTVIGPSRTDIPVKGLFSTGLFIRPYVEAVVRAAASSTKSCKSGIRINKKDYSAQEILDELNNLIEDTIDAVSRLHVSYVSYSFLLHFSSVNMSENSKLLN